MSEIVEHIDPTKLQRYQDSLLSPIELLDFDDHLSGCKICSLKMRRESDLSGLYQSFFEPVVVKMEKRYFFENLSLGRWIPQLGFALSAIAFLAGLAFIFTNPNKPEESQILAKNEKDIAIIENTTIPQTQHLEDAKPKSNSRLSNKTSNNTTNVNSGKSNRKSVRRTFNEQKALNNTKRKPAEVVGLTTDEFQISDLQSDNSQTLGSPDETNKTSSPDVQISKSNRNFSVKLKSEKDVREYEFYLAEMPNFKTISREKRSDNNWEILQNKFKVGKKYILQITVFKDASETQTIKKIISLKNKKTVRLTRTEKQKRGK
jgi:hypothetical protein